MSDRFSFTVRPDDELDLCAACGSHLVHPVRWRRLAEPIWELVLRCPDCEQVTTERAPDGVVRRFDASLREARALIEAHVDEIERIEREHAIVAFARALEAGAITPDDFERTR